MEVRHVPDVSQLHPAHQGEALIVSGWAATWDLDRVGDRFDPSSLDKALATYLSTNPVVLWKHNRDRPPIGKVLEAHIDRARGLWVKCLLPRPPAGSWAETAWWAVKNGLARAFSVGGRWMRQAAAGYQRIVDADLTEISIASVAVNGQAFADEVQSVEHVKALPNGGWEPIADFETRKREVLRQMELVKLQLEVARLNLL